MTTTAGELSGQGYVRVSDDFYIEPRWAVDLLLDNEPIEGSVLDPACGSGTIVRACQERGLDVYGVDIVSRNGCDTVDFLAPALRSYDNIICNPPYRLAQDFAEKALLIAEKKVCLLVQAKFLFSQKRNALFTVWPPDRLYFLSTRPSMPPGERYLAGEVEAKGGKLDYLWVVWDSNETMEHRTEAKWLIRSASPPSPALASASSSPS